MPDSNIDDVAKWLEDIIQSFNFRLDVGSGTMAENIRGLIALGINRRSINKQSGAEHKWKDNQPDYKEWKLRTYGSNKVGVMTGQMLSLLSLKGEMDLKPDEMTIYYGIGEPSDRYSAASVAPPKPRRSRKGQQNKKQKPPPTDIEKGEWFTYGCQEQNRPPRPFYEIDEQIEDDIDQLIEDFLSDMLTD